MMRYPVSRPSVGPRELQLVTECVMQNQLTQGPMVAEFEARFAEKMECSYAVACSSGTTALHLALAALGLGPGDEVLVPDLTFVATANAVRYTGAAVVLVDVDPYSWCLDVDKARMKVTPRTRAIVPVHLYGQPCDMTALALFAEAHALLIIEDAAQGLGGMYGNVPLGTLGDAGTFSFYGNKIITTGEGGMVVTDSVETAEKLRLLRGQGQSATTRYFHTVLGYNYRLTDLQAAFGIAQLEAFDAHLAQRQAVFAAYRQRLTSVGLMCIPPSGAPWLFTVILPDNVSRPRVQASLLEQGIDTRPVFVPLHRLPMYAGNGSDADFKVASYLGDHGLSLPTYPYLSTTGVDFICRQLFEHLYTSDEKVS